MTVQNLKDRMKNPTDGGFTLLEVLIVLAIIIVMVIVLIIAINPGQKLAETRDAGRMSSVNQLGRALQAWSTSNDGAFPMWESATWMTTLTLDNEISSDVAGVAHTLDRNDICLVNAYAAVGSDQGYCYASDTTTATTEGTDAIVYSALESDRSHNDCLVAEGAYALWSSVAGRTGIVCLAADPANGTGDTVYTFEN